MEGEVKLADNNFVEIEDGVVITPEEKPRIYPKLINTVKVEPKRNINGVGVENSIRIESDKIIITKNGKDIPLASISKSEVPSHGAYWKIDKNRHLFVLNISETKDRPIGMGGWCKSRTLVYQVNDDDFSQLTNSEFDCYHH